MSINQRIKKLEREFDEYATLYLPRKRLKRLWERKAALLDPLFEGKEMSVKDIHESVRLMSEIVSVNNSTPIIESEELSIEDIATTVNTWDEIERTNGQCKP